MKESRVANTVLNLKYGIMAQFINYILSFVTRTIFIKYLAVEYLGVNNLFSNIILLFSVAESGIGAAMESVLYGPMYTGDEKMVNSIVYLLKKAYVVISGVIFIMSIFIYPVLEVFTGYTQIDEIHIVYIMFVAKNICSYLFADSLSLLFVDQKRYLYIKYTQIATVLQYILQIVILVLTQNFLLYIFIQMACQISIYIAVRLKCKRIYSYIGKNKPMAVITDEIKNEIKKRCRSGFIIHLSYIIMNGTDTIVITRFLGMTIAGIYSNYIMIVQLVFTFSNIFYSSVKGGIGNLLAEKDEDLIFKTYNKLFFLTMLMVGFMASCLISLLNPFIKIWIGEAYLLNQATVIWIVLAFIFCNEGFRQIISIFKLTSGLFTKDKWLSLAEGVCNLIMSLLLVQKWGIQGILFSSVVSSFITTISTGYVNYKYIFKKDFKDFFVTTGSYLLKIGILCIGVYFLSVNIQVSNAYELVLLFVCTISATIAGLAIFFYRNEYFQYYKNGFMEIATKWLQKNRIHFK